MSIDSFNGPGPAEAKFSQVPTEQELLRQTLEGVPPGVGRYTEVHMTDEGPVVMVAPRDPVDYGASITGYHSIIDDGRDEGYDLVRFKDFDAFAKEHGLDSETVKAKGLVVKRSDEGFDLWVKNVRRQGEIDAWIGDLALKARELGLHEVFLDEAREQVVVGAPKIQAEVYRSMLLPGELDRENKPSRSVTAGIVSDIQVERRWKKGADGSYSDTQKLAVRAVEERTAFHHHLREYAGYDKDNQHPLTVILNGREIHLGCQYTLHNDQRVAQVAIMFDRNYGADGVQLQRAIARGLADDLSGIDTVEVKVADGTRTLQGYTIHNNKTHSA